MHKQQKLYGKVVAKTLTGDNNLATVTGQTGTAKNETYEVAVSENAVKAVAVNAALRCS